MFLRRAYPPTHVHCSFRKSIPKKRSIIVNVMAPELLGSISDMNLRSYSAVIILVASAIAGHAQNRTEISHNWTQRLYTEVDLGGVYQQENTTLYQSTGNSLTATFDLGIRGNVALGYDISKSFAVELDSGVLWNSMDKAGGTPLSSLDQAFDTYTVPFLATLIYKVPTRGSWYPYAGIGVGGAAAIASFNLGFNTPTHTDCSFVLAYQAEVGLEYKFTKHFSADVAYQFLGTSNPRWHSAISVAGNPPVDYQFKEEGFYTHSLVLSFTWHF